MPRRSRRRAHRARRNSILSGDFDRLKMATPVHYVEEIGDTGPIATKVRMKD